MKISIEQRLLESLLLQKYVYGMRTRRDAIGQLLCRSFKPLEAALKALKHNVKVSHKLVRDASVNHNGKVCAGSTNNYGLCAAATLNPSAPMAIPYRIPGTPDAIFTCWLQYSA